MHYNMYVSACQTITVTLNQAAVPNPLNWGAIDACLGPLPSIYNRGRGLGGRVSGQPTENRGEALDFFISTANSYSTSPVSHSADLVLK